MCLLAVVVLVALTAACRLPFAVMCSLLCCLLFVVRCPLFVMCGVLSDVSWLVLVV